MPIESLLRMTHQIGDFFGVMPDHDEALEGIATHLKKFWPPSMRRELLAYLDAKGTQELSPIVAEALARHRAMLG